jgi:TonB-dependent starch-binding outer membrane protein SusC
MKKNSLMMTVFGQGSRQRLFVAATALLLLQCHSLALNASNFFADQRVSGTVTDTDNAKLPGVSVIVKGTTTGTITDADGNYSINVPDSYNTLSFSFIGYRTKDVQVDNQSKIDVIMEEDVTQLGEVVVVGYGTMKKSDLTGAVFSANIESFRNQGNTNILQSLQGTVPGLNIGTVTAAGENPTFSVRGQTGLSSANSAPLIVLDGIIYRGNMQDINSDDIASVEVLKDASSTAIYGSQAANGVIIMTSKVGKLSKPTISVSSRYSLRGDANPLDYYDRNDYPDIIRAFEWKQNWQGPDYISLNPNFDPSDYLTPQEFQGFENGSNYKWREMITQRGFMQNHNVSISGKNDKATYYISGSVLDQSEVFIGDNYARNTGRVNLDLEVTPWLHIGTNSFLSNSDNSGIEFSTPVGSTFSPYSSPYDESGNLVRNPNGQISTNPFLLENDIDVDKRLQINGLVYATIDVPWIKGLQYRLNYGNSYRTLRQNRFSYTANNDNGQAYKNNTLFYDWTLDHILSYDKTFNSIHRINATLLYGREERYSEGTEARGDNYAINTLGINSLQNAQIEYASSSAFDESSLYSMARINYALMDRYILTATLRRDGFSGFGKNNKTAVFPSLAFGWLLSEESFLKDNLGPVSYLKLRGSVGRNGNRGVGRYGTLARVDVRDGYIFGDGGSTVLGQNLSSFPSPNLKWETTTGLNLGIDYEILLGRISGSFEFYNSLTEDILFLKPLPAIAGLSSVNDNIGSVRNKGFELSIRSNNLKRGAFKWDTQFNLSRNTNKIVSVLGSDTDGDGKEDDLRDAGLFIGESTGAVYDYIVDGVYQVGDGDIPAGFEPGFLRLRDIDGNGQVDTNDRTIIGRQEPAYRLGILNELSFKNIKLSFFINSVQGGKDGYLGNNSPWLIWTDPRVGKIEANRPKDWDFWTPDNPNAEYPSLRYQSSANPRFFRQRNFIRLQSINLSYAFNDSFLSRYGIQDLSVFVSGQNLFTWTKWVGLDPESGEGISFGRPVIRSFNFGFSLKF